MKKVLLAAILLTTLLYALVALATTSINNSIEKAKHRITKRFSSGKNVYCRSEVFSSTKKEIVSKTTGYKIVGDRFVNSSTDYSYDIVLNCSTSAN